MANDDGPRFRPVDPRVRFPELEERILAFWDDADVFRRSLEQREGAPEWVFYDGPPTANAKPHIGHALTRTFKDVYPRYRTMTGHLVHRKAGWDCHGLPVEIEVEKEIGTSGKRDIEAFGVAEFNERCRASVRRYVRDWEDLTRRIGFWIDMTDAYWTMDPVYVESVWWSLKRLHERGLLVEADKVTAYCPRCGTALSDAEVALGYDTVEDPSVDVRFPIVEASDADLVGASLLVWTTTPWTLPANTGVAVDPGGRVRGARAGRCGRDARAHRRGGAARGGGRRRRRRRGSGWTRGRIVPGRALLGARYEPPYPNVEGAHTVVAGDFVSMDDGTGIVHLAPAFGAEDLEVGRAQGWPVFKPVGDDGRFTDLGPEFIRGLFVKDADPAIIEDLAARGRLLPRRHDLAHLPVLLALSDPAPLLRADLVVRPHHRGEGASPRRERRRGLASRAHPSRAFRQLAREQRRLGALAGTLLGHAAADLAMPVDAPHGDRIARGARHARRSGPHGSRSAPPAIDEVVFACPECGEESRRVPEVIDAWYDSGAMPFAQWGYQPELGRGEELFERRFPADFISEAIDQTRGWFYTLMAEGVLHFDSPAYRAVVCFGFIVDEQGRKMSKSLGNVVDPMSVMERHGADALRWVLLTSGSPWSSRRLGDTVLEEAVRQFLLTLWHVYSFFVLYANADGADPDAATRPSTSRTDRSSIGGSCRGSPARCATFETGWTRTT